MAFQFDSAFSDVRTQDTVQDAAPGTFASAPAAPFLPSTKNYASDDKVVAQINGELSPLIGHVRSNRQYAEQEWDAIFNMENQRHDEGRRYFGRSDAYLPIYGRILGTAASSITKGLFPTDEYLDVTDRGSGDPERGKPVKAYLQWEFESVAKIKAALRPFIRQLAGFGTSPLKAVYKKEKLVQGRGKASRDFFSGLRLDPNFQPTAVYDGLHVSPRPLHSWYIYPQTVSSITEAQLIFEDTRVSRLYVKDMGYKGLWENIETALAGHRISQKDASDNERVMSAHGSPENFYQFDSNDIGGYVTLTEAWCFLHLPPDAYLPSEDKRLPLPVRVVMVGNVPVMVIRNPYYHQRPPYLVARDNVNPGYFYGSAHGRMVRWLQYLSNDLANQSNDVGIMGLNPIVKANPGALVGPLPPIGPGATWYTTDPVNGIVFDRPPIEQVQHGLSLLQTWMGAAFDLGGAPPILQGAGRGGKTATSSQILQRNAMIPYQDTVEAIENDVMVPLMFLTWLNAQQFREGAVIAAVAGENVRVSPEQLLIDPDFRWLGSNQATNSQMRNQQAIQFIQALMPAVPLLMQLGYVVDPVPLFNRMYSDGLGFRGFKDIIKPAAAMGGMMPGATPGPGQMPGVQAEQADRIRSTLEQLGQGAGEMVPGEGDDFMSVRGQADDLASMQGGSQ